MNLSDSGMVIAAVRSDEEFRLALGKKAEIIFDLNTDLLKITKRIRLAHENNKKLFVHMDFADGIGKAESGIRFLKSIGIDGIISTRQSIIKIARKLEIFTVQRFFIVDSHSVVTTVESVKAAKPDMIEVMPGIANKVIEKLSKSLNVPVIAGGLVETKEEANDALKCGATAVSTGKAELWEI